MTDDRALIHLVFAFDGNILPAACVAMKSAVLSNGGHDDFILHILNPGHGEAELQAVKSVMADCANAELRFITVTPSDFPSVLPPGPFMTYARLLIGRLIDASRVIYLDSDILVTGNLRQLWDTPFDGHALLAVAGHAWDPPGSYSELVRFGKKKETESPYFNAGVLVIDMEAFRAAQEEIFDVLSRYSRWLADRDQSVINYVFRGKIKAVPRQWNTCSQARTASKASIIHYQAPDRPWQYRKSAGVYRAWWKFYQQHVLPCTDYPALVELSGNRKKLPWFSSLTNKKSLPWRDRFLYQFVFWVGWLRLLVRRIRFEKKRVLIYKSSEDKTGDLILMTGVVPHYRRLFPEATLEMLCNDESVAMMQVTGAFDAVWPRSFLTSQKRPAWSNAGRTDSFVSLRRTINPSDEVWLDSFKPVRAIGFSGDLLTHRVSVLPRYKKKLDIECKLSDDGGESNLHELDVQRKMLSILGVDVDVEALHPVLPESYADFSMVDMLLDLYKPDKIPFYVCCPFGSQLQRFYGVDRWHEVIEQLAPCVIAVCGTEKDGLRVLELTAKPIAGVTAVNLAGQTTLTQLAGLLLRADVVLAAESGPMHMAIALKRPLVAVCGRGHYGRFVPYPYVIPNTVFLFADCEHSGCGWKCFSDQAVCINRIEPADVVDAVRRVNPCR